MIEVDPDDQNPSCGRRPRHRRPALVDSLSDLGYDVLEAADGEAGFQCALEEHPDIILLDVMMPIRGQFEVLQKLKSNRATSAALVIMVSAKGQEQDINTAMDAGAWNYIVKPWEQEDLEAKVMAAAEKAQKAA